MSKREMVLSEIDEAPEPILDEVLDFIHFLKARVARERMDTMVAAESSLKKDWLKREEDEAWQGL